MSPLCCERSLTANHAARHLWVDFGRIQRDRRWSSPSILYRTVFGHKEPFARANIRTLRRRLDSANGHSLCGVDGYVLDSCHLRHHDYAAVGAANTATPKSGAANSPVDPSPARSARSPSRPADPSQSGRPIAPTDLVG
jgi:hypothetical protein